jgi:uncharacterized protein (DUF4415 family)
MTPKPSAPSTRARRAEPSAPQPPDSEIDFSDFPELTEEQLSRMRRVGRPPIGDAVKKSIAIRINPNLLADLRSMAARKHVPYQTLIHDILEKSVARASRGTASRRR